MVLEKFKYWHSRVLEIFEFELNSTSKNYYNLENPVLCKQSFKEILKATHNLFRKTNLKRIKLMHTVFLIILKNKK